MTYNHCKAYIEFQKTWKRLRKEYKEAGMSDDAIEKIYQFDVCVFNRDRAFIEHIFELSANGMGEQRICYTLEDECVLSPGVYLFNKNGSRAGHPNFDTPFHWSERTVRRMLRNQVYCGDTVNFKTYSKSNKLKKRLNNDPENIFIFKNTHEAIVDRSLYDTVQKHFAGRKRSDTSGMVDMLAGYLYCSDCGSRMYIQRKINKPDKTAYVCGKYRSGHGTCTIHHIHESVIKQIVLDNLRRVTSFARNDPEKFYELAMKHGKTEAAKNERIAINRRDSIHARIKKIDTIIRCLYEDRVDGRITPQRYDEMVADYEHEQAELKKTLNAITEELQMYDKQENAVKNFIAKANQYIDMPILTAELLHAFINRIVVYEKTAKYSKVEGNAVVIYYNYQITRKEQFGLVFGEESAMSNNDFDSIVSIPA